MVMKTKPTRKETARMRANPYYAVLYAINKIKGRLPSEVEECLVGDPEACLLYSERVICGPLPDFLHNSMVLGDWAGGERDSVEEYLRKYFPEGSRA